MLLPIGVERQRRRPPVAVIVLIAVNVLMYFAAPPPALGGMKLHPLYEALVLHTTAERFRLYQVFTHAFLHGFPMHIIGNMVFLWVFGAAVNDRIGDRLFAAVYLLACPVAAAAELLFLWNTKTHMVGASGAVSAVSGLFIVLMPNVRVKVLYWFFFIGVARIRGLWFIGLNMAFDFFLALGHAKDGVAHFAHIGGFLAGAAAAAVLLQTGLLPRAETDLLAMLGMRRRRGRGRRPAPRRAEEQIEDAEFRTIWSRGERIHGQDTRSLPEKIEHEMAEALDFGDHDVAMRFYERLLKDHPGHILSSRNMLAIGEAMAGAGSYREAVTVFDRFRKTFPRDIHRGQCEYDLGMIYALYLNDAERARMHLESALRFGIDERREAQARKQLEEPER